MSLITKMLKKGRAVYWPPVLDEDGGPVSDEFGMPTFEDPVQIKCRWEDYDVEFVENAGRQEESKARVYVDRDVQLKGVLWKGLIEDLVEAEDPFKNPGAWEIKKFDKIPNLRQTKFVRIAWL